ncbi:hypothetical protein JCM18899A_18960 [Nocardioides sp. AN3]
MSNAAAFLASRRSKSALEARMIDMTEAKSSAVLLAAHAELTSRATLDAAERLTLATIADVLTARHDLDDAIDAFFDADDNFEATYHEALLYAMAVKGVEI